MGELRHIVCLVKLRRIDFVHIVSVGFPLLQRISLLFSIRDYCRGPYAAIVALHEYTSIF